MVDKKKEPKKINFLERNRQKIKEVQTKTKDKFIEQSAKKL